MWTLLESALYIKLIKLHYFAHRLNLNVDSSTVDSQISRYIAENLFSSYLKTSQKSGQSSKFGAHLLGILLITVCCANSYC